MTLHHCLRGGPPPGPRQVPPPCHMVGVRGSEEREGWFKGEGHKQMHVHGRQWGDYIKDCWNAKKGMPYKGSIYDVRLTFESYSIPH